MTTIRKITSATQATLKYIQGYKFSPKSNWDVLGDFLILGNSSKQEIKNSAEIPERKGLFRTLTENLSETK